MEFREFKDIDYAVEAEPLGDCVGFTVWQIAGVDQDTGETLYMGIGCHAESDRSRVDPEFSGSVMRDGCSNWSISDQIMFHGCTRQDLINLGECLARCWDWASELIENWDGE